VAAVYNRSTLLPKRRRSGFAVSTRARSDQITAPRYGNLACKGPRLFLCLCRSRLLPDRETRGYKGGNGIARRSCIRSMRVAWAPSRSMRGLITPILAIVSPSGALTAASQNRCIPTSGNYVNGGKLIGYQGSLIWLPTDYVKFLLGSTRALTSRVVQRRSHRSPTSPQACFERPYNVDQVGLRAQLDF